MICDPPLILLSQTLSLHPDLSIALPIQALLLIPQFLQPQSWADVSTKASSWRQTERQVSHIWKVSRILKRVISSIQSEFVALKVWLTITYNVSFENQGYYFFFFCSEVSLWAEDLGSIRKNLVLLWDLASSCRMREWVASQVFPNEFLLSLASYLGSPKESLGPWILSEGVTANIASWQIAGPNCPQSLAWTSQEHLCRSPCKVTSRWK